MRNIINLICKAGIVLTITYGEGYGQSTSLQIDEKRPVNAIVKALEGPGVEIFNIKTTIPEGLGQSTAFFDDVLGIMDIDKGLLMTNGSALDAKGPNNAPDKGTLGGSEEFGETDSDLSLLISEELFDLVIVEFDVIGTFDELSFNYVFGSEEYPEFVDREFNDVFGFFISGPGISGTKNLAVVGDNNPVSINSINAKSNSEFFMSNGTGKNPALNFYIQYDGYTKKLEAKATIIPCETYHIKLAIADAGDDILDSGVFIEQGSFTTTSSFTIDVSYEHEAYDYAIEECNKGFFTVNRSTNSDISKEVTLNYTLTGTASNGLDYSLISTPTLTLAPGKLSASIEIDPTQDGIEEGEENIILTVTTNECDRVKSVIEAIMPLRDQFEYTIPDVKSCEDALVTLNESAPDRYSFKWEDNDLLSCTDCPSPMVSTPKREIFRVEIQDKIAGCKTSSEVMVSSDLVDAFFKYSSDDNYTSIDAFFDNLSSGADRYEWQFGDGNKSSEFEPAHTYTIKDFFKEAQFTIKLTAFADSLGCMDMYDTTIVIQEPFFIPNVITPGNDMKNDTFVVKGIRRNTWALEIFNRWGKLVYENANYNQEWDSNGLSDGVYFYQLTNPNGDRQFTGWVQTFKQ